MSRPTKQKPVAVHTAAVFSGWCAAFFRPFHTGWRLLIGLAALSLIGARTITCSSRHYGELDRLNKPNLTMWLVSLPG
jgi:hypothetical protein